MYEYNMQWYNSKKHKERKNTMEKKKNTYCKIRGEVRDLYEVQEILDSRKEINGEILGIMREKYNFEILEAFLFEQMVIEKGIPEDYDEVKKQHDFEISQRKSCLVHCPRCGSTNVEEREFLPLPWASFQKYWYCKNCHSRFDV